MRCIIANVRALICSALLFPAAVGCSGSAHKRYSDLPELCPLGNAARHQDLTRLNTLLSGRVDVNVHEKNGETALYDALECDRPECDNVPVIDALLNHGAALNLNLSGWGTPLTFSLTRDYGSQAASLELIHRGSPISKTCNGEDTDLSFATQNFELNVMSALLDGGADPNCKNSYGDGPLFWAVINGQADAAELLLKHGASLSESAPDGQTILQVAKTTNPDQDVQKKFSDTRNVLIRYGAK
jgi:ankyrin repeat protein